MAAGSTSIILSTFADGPYWPSALEVLGPRHGCSFYRAFNYRDDYVHEDLLNQVQQGLVVTRKSVIGMRFGAAGSNASDDEKGRFVPLRLADAQLYRDDAYVRAYLRLGPYVPANPDDNDLWAMSIAQSHLQNGDGGPLLAWAASPSEEASVAAWEKRGRDIPDSSIWRLLGTSGHLSAETKGSFDRGVVLYARDIVHQSSGRPAVPKQIYEDQRSIKFYGYSFNVAERVTAELEMRTIGSAGRNALPAFPGFAYATNADLVTPTATDLPLTGNYRELHVALNPRARVKGRADLQWVPTRSADEDGAREAGPGLRLPFVVERSFPTAPAVGGAALLLLGALMLTLSINLDDVSDSARSILQALGTTFVGIAIAFGREALTEWREQS